MLLPPDARRRPNPNGFGHLLHHIRLQCPEELGVVVCEVLLDRFEELGAGLPRELRPTLAVGDQTVLFPGPDRRPQTCGRHSLWRPAEIRW